MDDEETRRRLGEQISRARRNKQWRLGDVAYRSTNTPGRLSVIENGKANATVDTLAQVGAVMGLSLIFVPTEKLAEVLAFIGQPLAKTHLPTEVSSVFDEVFIPDPVSEEEEIPHARP